MNRAIVKSFDGNYNGERLVDFIWLPPAELIDRERVYIKRTDFKPWKLPRTALKYDGGWRGIYQAIREENK